MKASSRDELPRLRTSSSGGPTANTLPACINEMRSQRSASFMKWVDKEDGDAVVTRQVDERAPESVAGDRVHPRGRLVEDEHGRAVQDRDGKLQPLLYAQRQALGTRVGDIR